MLILKNKKMLLGSFLSTLAILLISSLTGWSEWSEEFRGREEKGCNYLVVIGNSTSYHIWIDNVLGQKSNASPVVPPKVRKILHNNSCIKGNSGTLIVSKGSDIKDSITNPIANKEISFPNSQESTNVEWKPFEDGPKLNISVTRLGVEVGTNETVWLIEVTEASK